MKKGTESIRFMTEEEVMKYIIELNQQKDDNKTNKP